MAHGNGFSAAEERARRKELLMGDRRSKATRELWAELQLSQTDQMVEIREKVSRMDARLLKLEGRNFLPSFREMSHKQQVAAVGVAGGAGGGILAAIYEIAMRIF